MSHGSSTPSCGLPTSSCATRSSISWGICTGRGSLCGARSRPIGPGTPKTWRWCNASWPWQTRPNMAFRASNTAVGVLAACLLLVRQLGVGATPGGATGRALALDDLVARVQAQYERTTHLHAQFRQEIRVRGFDQAHTGAGQVWILKPGMMRWEYTKPERQTIIANGDMLWIYLPEERQVIRDRVHESLGSRTPALFLAGQARLTELFAVTGPSSQAPGEEGLLRLELTPKQGALPYAQVQ